MKPRLILHIGASKAGSSAIQEFLKLNANALAAREVIVPSKTLDMEAEVTGEQIWFLEEAASEDVKAGTDMVTRRMMRLVAQNTPDAPDAPEDKEDKKGKKDKEDKEEKGAETPPATEKAQDTQAAPDAPDAQPLTIIVSAENMSNSQGHEWLFSKLRDIFDIKVLIYIRRQDDFLMSGWQQWYLKTAPDFWAWLVENLGSKGDWFAHLEPWRKIFGLENLEVRIFARDQLVDQDLIADFCQAVGLETEGLTLGVGNRNPSHSIAVQEIAHAANNLFSGIHDNEFYQMVTDLTGATFQKENRQTFLTKRQRLAILGKYFISNQNILKTYFPDRNPNEPLFAPIAGSSEIIDVNELERQKMAVLTTMIYSLYKKQKRNE